MLTLKINDGGVCGIVDSATIVYWLLVAVYLIYIYFENICNFISLYKNKLYICITKSNKYKLWQL